MKTDKYQISVIVPVYNTGMYLPRCVDSLLGQKIPIRIILVDDGSTDNSGELCDQYAREHLNITVIHKPNGGAGSAKNAGIECADTEFVGFVDSDDWITDDMYAYLLDLQRSYQADVVQIEYFTATEGNTASAARRKEKVICLDSRESILKRYLEDGMKPTKSYSMCTKLYQRKLFSGIRFPEDKAYDDVVTNYDLLSKADRYLISNRQCYCYAIRQSSITKGRFCKADLDYIAIGEQIVSRTEGDPNLKSLGNMTLARFHFTCLCKMLKYGCEETVEWKQQIRTSIPIIRRGMKELLRSGMKKDRKALMLLLCSNTRLSICIGWWRMHHPVTQQ